MGAGNTYLSHLIFSIDISVLDGNLDTDFNHLIILNPVRIRDRLKLLIAVHDLLAHRQFKKCFAQPENNSIG